MYFCKPRVINSVAATFRLRFSGVPTVEISQAKACGYPSDFYCGKMKKERGDRK